MTPAAIESLLLALPTVDLRASFVRPVRLGETLTIATIVGAVGRSSVELTTDVTCDGKARFSVRYKQVLMGMREARAVRGGRSATAPGEEGGADVAN